ncbi:Hypp3820 [Branchiostoma lanceolatum]|uniref:Hypp3820 protein n=1 Tax=Branchiostoma lanceolatum TaxID=7740 RepID=A0A8K0A2F7_BRALA|nr:Hypp3820 [Branchiostoma lanceolatum]
MASTAGRRLLPVGLRLQQACTPLTRRNPAPLRFYSVDASAKAVALTDFQRKKIENCFDFYDINNDGILRFDEDFETALKAYIKLNGWTEDSKQYVQYYRRWVAFWNNLYAGKMFRKDGKGDQQITREEFHSMWTHALMNRTDINKAPRWVRDLIPNTYHAIDTDGDNTIKLKDYEKFFEAFGRNNSAADIFNKLDINGDGMVSRTEWDIHMQDFFISEDETRPGNHLWGYLQ